MGLPWYVARATWRRSWRMTLLVALIGGLLGAVALGALAGARRTESAYDRYLRSVNASDVSVDIPGPLLFAVKDVEHLSGTLSSVAWLGLNGEPVIDGKVDTAFQTGAIAGSLDGEFYRQDELTVLAGKLPPESSTRAIIITQNMATAFRLTVGDHMTWQFTRFKVTKSGLPEVAKSGQTPLAGPPENTTYTVAAIVDVSPALVDDFDSVDTAILPPAATAQHLNGGWQFGWASLRLRRGDADVDALQRQLRSLATAITSQKGFSNFPLTFTIRRMAIVQREAQQAIEPQAVALAVLGGLAVIALLALMAQGLAQMLARSAADAPALRAMGGSRAAAAAATAAWGAVAVAGAVVISIGGAIAVSPLAPIGPVRLFDPVRGFQADWLVLGGGGFSLLLLLTAVLTWLAWRAVRHGGEVRPAQSSVLLRVATSAGLPVTMIAGIRHALERGSGRLRAPVRATLTGTVIAVTALVAALVFGASLTGLYNNPAKQGWTWDLLVQSQGGWGSWPPGALDKTFAAAPGVTGWAEAGFAQLTIRGAEIPAMGLLQHVPAHPVEPPTTSGHPLTGLNQVEFGTVTMRQLGLHIGQRILLGDDKQPVTIVGTVTLPSIGVVLTDHPSLGRGVMMNWATLMTVLGERMNPTQTQISDAVASTAYPATVVFDLRSPAAGRRIISEMAVLSTRSGSPGGTYQLRPQLERGAAVLNAGQMGREPLAMAIGVAAAAVLALGLAILASVRQRRLELALLKSLGLRARQIRAIIAWQTSTILAIAVALGVPLGIAGGQWAWTSFANSIGVVPSPVVPGLSLLAGVALLLLAGNLLAAFPAFLAARIAPAAVLRTE